MKTMLRIGCTACAAALLSTQPLLAQTWQTVLDYQLAPGQNAGGQSIAADPLGRILCVGDASDANAVTHGIALTTDSTMNWLFGDDNDPDPTKYSSDNWACGYDSNGNLYSVGQLWPLPNTGTAFWDVRRSSDGGAHWSTLYEPNGTLYQYTPGQWVYPTGFAADSSGNIYVVGAGRDLTVTGSGRNAKTQSNIHWLVRKSSDAGLTWTLVDDVILGNAYGDAASVVPGTGVFVVGTHFTTAGGWFVRQSPSGETGTWATMDQPYTQSAAAHGVVGDIRGNVYVVGEKFIVTSVVKSKGQNQTNGYYAWVTRMSAAGGKAGTWNEVDTYALAPNASARALGIATNSAGKVVVVGSASDGTHTRWIVRAPDSSGNWGTIDDFQPGLGSAMAVALVSDAAGNLLVTGEANSGDGTGYHLIVRRLPASTP